MLDICIPSIKWVYQKLVILFRQYNSKGDKTVAQKMVFRKLAEFYRLLMLEILPSSF